MSPPEGSSPASYVVSSSNIIIRWFEESISIAFTPNPFLPSTPSLPSAPFITLMLSVLTVPSSNVHLNIIVLPPVIGVILSITQFLPFIAPPPMSDSSVYFLEAA